MAVLVVLNNWLHDLTTGLWVTGTVLLLFLSEEARKMDSREVTLFYRAVAARLYRANLVSLGLVVFFGIGRSLAYFRYEYLPAAGRGQLVALAVKHVILFSLVAIGLVWQSRIRKDLR